MIQCIFRTCLILAAISIAAPSAAVADSEGAELVSKARFTVQHFASDKEIGPTVRRLMKSAKAVMIYPNIIKGAFLFGGEVGSGVLLAKGGSGTWSYPAFYTLGAASFGLQIGGQSSEVMLLIMTNKGISSVIDNEVKLGADLSVAAGPVGIGAEASTTTNFGADIYTFSRNEGAFLGASFEGAVIHPRQSRNTGYYNSERATPKAIVFDRRFGNVQADTLRSSLAKLK